MSKKLSDSERRKRNYEEVQYLIEREAAGKSPLPRWIEDGLARKKRRLARIAKRAAMGLDPIVKRKRRLVPWDEKQTNRERNDERRIAMLPKNYMCPACCTTVLESHKWVIGKSSFDVTMQTHKAICMKCFCRLKGTGQRALESRKRRRGYR